MITKELIERINDLARIKKSRGLTPNEAEEQKRLYKIYLTSIREQVTTQLDAAGLNPQSHECRDIGCDHQHGPNCGHEKH